MIERARRVWQDDEGEEEMEDEADETEEEMEGETTEPEY